jgi:micrococcal nuclease
MSRLVLAGGPSTSARSRTRGPAARRSGARRSRRSAALPRRLGRLAGYGLCLLTLLAIAALDRLDLSAPAENWTVEAEAPPPAAAGAVRVVDGDTLDIAGERIRLSNIDAPEMPPKAQCPSEARGALVATARLNTLVKGGEVTIDRQGEDRYGRTLAHVYVDGADAGRTLIAAGLVRPWEGKRRSWCV